MWETRFSHQTEEKQPLMTLEYRITKKYCFIRQNLIFEPCARKNRVPIEFKPCSIILANKQHVCDTTSEALNSMGET